MWTLIRVLLEKQFELCPQCLQKKKRKKKKEKHLKSQADDNCLTSLTRTRKAFLPLLIQIRFSSPKDILPIITQENNYLGIF